MAPKTRHGHAVGGVLSHEYVCWSMMKQRCLNPKATAFRWYGGRGIGVCQRWLKFDNFIADVGPAPSMNHSLDRFPRRDGDYEPGNVRWATTTQQRANQRRSGGKLLTIDKVVSIRRQLAKGRSRRAIAKDFGVTYHTVADIALGRTWKEAVAISAQ